MASEIHRITPIGCPVHRYLPEGTSVANWRAEA